MQIKGESPAYIFTQQNKSISTLKMQKSSLHGESHLKKFSHGMLSPV